MIELPSSLDTSILADWSEASCLFGNLNSVSKAEIEESLEGGGATGAEEIVADIWQELEVRHRIAGDAHPIITFPTRMERTRPWDDAEIYSFQLLLSMQAHLQSMRVPKAKWTSTAKVFERVATVTLERYLRGKAINIGAPRQEGLPKRFDACLEHICLSLGEDRGAQRLFTRHTQDDGVDVVAWRPFGDGRPGQIAILAQCAAGADWKEKIIESEIPIGLWREHISWVTCPLKAFVFPFVCIDDASWRRFSHASGGFILDRLRITATVDAGGQVPTSLREEAIEWCRGRLGSIPWSA